MGLSVQGCGSRVLLRAAILALLASFFHSISTLLIKTVAEEISEVMAVFFRFLVSTSWIGMVLVTQHLQGKRFPLKTRHLGWHFFRATCTVISMTALYYAIRYVPLANANSLMMTYTLFIPIFSLLFFKTTTNYKSWLALIIGFSGILLILQPNRSEFNPKALVALISGLSIALSMLGVYELAKDDPPHTIMLYYFPITLILSGILTIFNWKTPSLFALSIMLGAGVAGTAYQELITRAVSYVSPRIISPLLYFGVIFSGIFDWIFWLHAPNYLFWVGSLLITAGSILAIHFAKSPV